MVKLSVPIYRLLVVLLLWTASVVFSHAEESFLASLDMRIGDLEFVERKDYPEKELGYSLRYQSGEYLKADIYVYDNGLVGLKEGTSSPEALDEMKSIAAVLHRMGVLRKYSDVQEIQSDQKKFKELKVDFLWSRHSYAQPVSEGGNYEGTRISDSYLTIHKGKFVKLRLTVKETELSKERQSIDQFVLDVATLISEDR